METDVPFLDLAASRRHQGCHLVGDIKLRSPPRRQCSDKNRNWCTAD